MARNAGGTVFEQPAGSGRYFGRFTTTRRRKAVRLFACANLREARERTEFIAGELQRLRQAGCEEHAPQLFKLAARADARQLTGIRRSVDAIIAGDVEPVPAQPMLSDGGPTFREFAEQWTSGELTRLHSDHVKRKKTADDDIYRLEAHVYPVVENVLLRSFTIEHAVLVMRSLDSSLSAGSRRQVAQLLRPRAFACRLSCSDHRREPHSGGIPSEARGRQGPSVAVPRRGGPAAGVHRGAADLSGALRPPGAGRYAARRSATDSWLDIDLEHGTVTLDQNKTNDPRAWRLGDDVVQALARWRQLQKKGTKLVFEHAHMSIDSDHLAVELRRHLSQIEGIRPILFQRTAKRAPLRAHDLRATFVTLALASGKTETWVCDRTGHRSSNMLNKYRRAARTAEELGLGWLKPMHEVIPELVGAGGRSRDVEPGGGTELQPAGASAGRASERVRAKLVAALTESIRELVEAGDMAGAQVAIEALRRLVPEGEPTTGRLASGRESSSNVC